MAKVIQAKAGKDYPEHGIKKGQTYWHWTPFRQARRISAAPPKRSQLTGVAGLSDAYAAEEQLEVDLAAAETPEDVAQALRDAAEAAGSAAGVYDEKISNLQEAFQGGCPQLEEAEQQQCDIQQWQLDLEAAADAVEAIEPSEHGGTDGKPFGEQSEEVCESWMEAARDEASGVSLDA